MVSSSGTYAPTAALAGAMAGQGFDLRIQMKRLLLISCMYDCSNLCCGGSLSRWTNYIDPTNPSSGNGYGSVTLSSIGITSCYYVSNVGLDSNNGTSESTSLLHAPWMTGYTGSAITPAAGEGFIFRGGDSWHAYSGTVLIGATSMTVSQSGSSEVRSMSALTPHGFRAAPSRARYSARITLSSHRSWEAARSRTTA